MIDPIINEKIKKNNEKIIKKKEKLAENTLNKRQIGQYMRGIRELEITNKVLEEQ
jgi:hypothetical protein